MTVPPVYHLHEARLSEKFGLVVVVSSCEADDRPPAFSVARVASVIAMDGQVDGRGDRRGPDVRATPSWRQYPFAGQRWQVIDDPASPRWAGHRQRAEHEVFGSLLGIDVPAPITDDAGLQLPEDQQVRARQELARLLTERRVECGVIA